MILFGFGFKYRLLKLNVTMAQSLKILLYIIKPAVFRFFDLKSDKMALTYFYVSK
jgi:hypothetical protein